MSRHDALLEAGALKVFTGFYSDVCNSCDKRLVHRFKCWLIAIWSGRLRPLRSVPNMRGTLRSTPERFGSAVAALAIISELEREIIS